MSSTTPTPRPFDANRRGSDVTMRRPSHSDRPRPLRAGAMAQGAGLRVALTPHAVTAMAPLAAFYAPPAPFAAPPPRPTAVASTASLRSIAKGKDGTERNERDDAWIGVGGGFGPERTVMVTGHSHGQLLCWDAETFGVVRETRHHNGMTIRELLVTTNRIVTLVDKVEGGHGRSNVYVWVAESLALVAILDAHDSMVTTMAIDRIGKDNRLFTGGGDRYICEWDLVAVDPSNTMRKWLAHGTHVTKLAVTEELVVSGASDSSIKVWRRADASLLQTLEGHQGGICFLFCDDKLLRTACLGGVVRCYSLKSKVATLLWSNKSHKALITSVAWDDRVTISSSTTDGVTIYHQIALQAQKVPFEAGVREVAVDPTRRLAVCAVDNGELTILSYQAFYDQSLEDGADAISVVSTVPLHISSISCVRVEWGAYGQWERIFTASNDGTICEVDFDLYRGAQVYDGSPQGLYCTLPRSAGLVRCCGTTGVLWDAEVAVPRSGPNTTLEGHEGRITCVELASEIWALMTGSEDGTLRLWPLSLYESEDDSTKQEFVFPGWSVAAPNGYIPIVLSEASGTCAAVGLTKGATTGARTGMLTLLFLNSRELHPMPMALMTPPVRLSCHQYHTAVGPRTTRYVVVAQQWSGEVLIFAAWDDARRPMVLLRQLVKEQWGMYSDPETTLYKPPRVHAELVDRYQPPALQVLYAERARLRVALVPSEEGGAVSALLAVDLPSDAVDVGTIGMGPLRCCAALESGVTQIFGESGEVLYEVYYDGSTSASTDALTVRHRSTVRTDVNASMADRRVAPCSALMVIHERRTIAVGYRDGMVVLWHMASHVTFRRIAAVPHCPIARFIAVGTDRWVTVGLSGTVRFDRIHARTLRGTSRPPTSTEAAAERRPTILGSARSLRKESPR